MRAQDIRAAMKHPPSWSTKDGQVSFWSLEENFNGGSVWVGRFTGMSPWERHPDGEELLHVLEGEVDVTVITKEGPTTTVLKSGSVFVVPRGLWHRHYAREEVLEYGATPGKTEHSAAEEPPRRSKRLRTSGRVRKRG